jgi:hypothetical protein
MSDRERRLAKNEALFRDVNERVQEIATAELGRDDIEFLCECVLPECLERIVLSVDEYERVRADPHRFFLKSGHERLDVEDVVERHEAYAVVRKHPETWDVVEDTDPRSD